MLESALKGGGIGAELPLIRAVGRHIPLRTFRNMFAASDYLLQKAKKAVTEANAGEGTNLFAHIINEAGKGQQLDDLDVQLEASGLIVAGSDTTAITLTYLVWAVLSRPSLHKALREELEGLADSFEDKDLEGLPILNAVMEETLRLYGAAPGSLPRVVPHGGTMFAKGKYFCPAGTIISTQSYTLHRDPDIFHNPQE